MKPVTLRVTERNKMNPLKMIGEELLNLEINLKKRPVTAPHMRPPSPVVSSSKRAAVKPSSSVTTTRRSIQVWKM